MTATLTGIANEPNQDGSHSVLIDHDGKHIEVVIPLQHLLELMGKIQIAGVDRAYEMNRNMRVPQLTVNRIDIAHQGPICELMVSTTQTGTVVLLMEDDWAKSCRKTRRHFRSCNLTLTAIRLSGRRLSGSVSNTTREPRLTLSPGTVWLM
jgi:hypothetical protein